MFFLCADMELSTLKSTMKTRRKETKIPKLFFSEVKRLFGGYKGKLIVVLGDINAHIGQNYIEILRKSTSIDWGAETNKVHTHTNTRGREFVNFCAEKKLIVASALFPNKSNKSKSPTYEKNANETSYRTYVDHFAIGRVNPKENDWTEDNSSECIKSAGVKTLDPNGKAICTNVRATDKKLPNARENYHFLCVASLDLRNADDRKADANADGNNNGNAVENADANADTDDGGNANGNAVGNSNANADGSANRSAEGSANGNADGSANGTADGSAVGKADANADRDIGEVASLLEAQALDDPPASKGC